MNNLTHIKLYFTYLMNLYFILYIYFIYWLLSYYNIYINKSKSI